MNNAPHNPLAQLEGKLGGRVTVWIGAIALALGGVFLVKFSIDQGLISPTLRILSGLAVGMGMAVAAWLVRARSNYVAQGLAAAAVADVFACIWAAVNLYEMIPPEVGFAAMAGTAACAAIMSRGLGPIVAIVGLLGGFLTPLLLPGEANAWLLFGYFLLLQAGTEALARQPGRSWLSVISVSAGALWALGFVAHDYSPTNLAWVAVFGLLSHLLFSLSGNVRSATGTAAGVVSGLLASLLALLSLLIGELTTEHWILFGLVLASVIVTARLREHLAPTLWGAASAAMIAALVALEHAGSGSHSLVPVLLMAGASALLSLLAMGSSRPGQWLSVAGVTTALMLVAAMYRRGNTMQVEFGEDAWLFGVLGLSVLTFAAAWPALLERLRGAWVPAASAFAMISLAGVRFLDAEWFTLLWAAQLPLLVLLARVLDNRALANCGHAMAGLVFLSFGLNPYLPGFETGTWPLLNLLSPMYVTAIGGLLLSHHLLPQDQSRTRQAYLLGAAWLALVGLTLQFRHLATGGILDAAMFQTTELVAYFGLWLTFGMALVRWFGGHIVLRQFGEIVAVMSTVYSVLILGIVRCPILARELVGGLPVLNMLAVIYLLPAGLMAGAAWALRGRTEKGLISTLIAASAAMTLGWIALSVRHAFHGSQLWGAGAATGEHLAYSLAMAAGAVAMLIWGLRTQHRGWRIAGLVAIGVCTCKVFLFDASATEGLYRALSFMGLGASLMGLGYLYNRFVIKDFAPAPEPALPPRESILTLAAPEDRAA